MFTKIQRNIFILKSFRKDSIISRLQRFPSIVEVATGNIVKLSGNDQMASIGETQQKTQNVRSIMSIFSGVKIFLGVERNSNKIFYLPHFLRLISHQLISQKIRSDGGVCQRYRMALRKYFFCHLWFDEIASVAILKIVHVIARHSITSYNASLRWNAWACSLKVLGNLIWKCWKEKNFVFVHHELGFQCSHLSLEWCQRH